MRQPRWLLPRLTGHLPFIFYNMLNFFYNLIESFSLGVNPGHCRLLPLGLILPFARGQMFLLHDDHCIPVQEWPHHELLFHWEKLDSTELYKHRRVWSNVPCLINVLTNQLPNFRDSCLNIAISATYICIRAGNKEKATQRFLASIVALGQGSLASSLAQWKKSALFSRDSSPRATAPPYRSPCKLWKYSAALQWW